MISLIFLLYACSSGGSVKNTSKIAYGQLKTSESETKFPVDTLKQIIKASICPSTGCTDDFINTLNTNYKANFDLNNFNENVSTYSITYNTPGVDGEERLVSGAVTIPQGTIKGVVLFYHPTSMNYDVPSCMTSFNSAPSQMYCDTALNGGMYGSTLGLLLSAVYSSQGYVVIAPDYIGQGVDKQIMHPYTTFPYINAVSGINMLIAAKTLMRNLDIQEVDKLYITGFSEGGAYALWATKILQNEYANVLLDNSYILRQAAPMDGEYDLTLQWDMALNNQLTGAYNYSTQMIEPNNAGSFFIFSNLLDATSKPYLMAKEIVSEAYYKYNASYLKFFNEKFFNMNCNDCSVKNVQYNLSKIFNSNNILPATTVIDSILNQAEDLGYGYTNNSVLPLINNQQLTDVNFISSLVSNSLTQFETNVPINFITLMYDSEVTNLSSIKAYNGVNSKSQSNLANLTLVNNADFYIPAAFIKETPGLNYIDHNSSAAILAIIGISKFN